MPLVERIQASASISKISNKNINPQSLMQGDPPLSFTDRILGSAVQLYNDRVVIGNGIDFLIKTNAS
jgi:hypothetical protein